MDILVVIVFILIFIIGLLVVFAYMQLNMAGIKVKDFWSFIEANQALDRLHRVAKTYQYMSAQEQIIFLKESEKIFSAFDKVPEMLWEEEYNKYSDVLNAYRKIKIIRWSEN